MSKIKLNFAKDLPEFDSPEEKSWFEQELAKLFGDDMEESPEEIREKEENKKAVIQQHILYAQLHPDTESETVKEKRLKNKYQIKEEWKEKLDSEENWLPEPENEEKKIFGFSSVSLWCMDYTSGWYWTTQGTLYWWKEFYENGNQRKIYKKLYENPAIGKALQKVYTDNAQQLVEFSHRTPCCSTSCDGEFENFTLGDFSFSYHNITRHAPLPPTETDTYLIVIADYENSFFELYDAFMSVLKENSLDGMFRNFGYHLSEITGDYCCMVFDPEEYDEEIFAIEHGLIPLPEDVTEEIWEKDKELHGYYYRHPKEQEVCI